MIETVTTGSGTGGPAAAARLLHDFDRESDEPAPPPVELAARLAELVDGSHMPQPSGAWRGSDDRVDVVVEHREALGVPVEHEPLVRVR